MSQPDDKEHKLTAFIAMCFDTKLDHIYHRVVKTSLAAFGIYCCRADEIPDTGQIVEQITEAISKADIVLCDLTYHNPNVFYELGIAHTLKKPTLMISQQAPNFPFDVRHMRIIPYEDTNVGLLDLREHLLDAIGAVLHREKNATYTPQAIFDVTLDDLKKQRYALFANSIEVRRYAIKFLGDCKDKDSYMKISRIADIGNDSDLMRDAYTAIHKIDPEAALPQLLGSGLTHQKDHLVRERVVALLSNYPPTTLLVRRMIDQSTDTSWGVRRAVCMTMGRWGDKEAIPALQTMLGDPELQVQLAALEAINAINAKVNHNSNKKESK